MATRHASIVSSLNLLEPRLRAALRRILWLEIAFLGSSAVVISFCLDRWLELPLLLRVALLGGVVWLGLKTFRRGRRRMGCEVTLRDLASTVEHYDPSLDGQLVNSLELPEDVRRLRESEDARLDARLLEKALDEAESSAAAIRSRIHRALDLAGIWKRAGSALLALALFLWIALGSPQDLLFWFRRNVLLSSVPWPRQTHFTFDRKEAEWHHPRKDPLEISAWVTGVVPRDILLHLKAENAEKTARLTPGASGQVSEDLEDSRRGAASTSSGEEEKEPPRSEGKRLFHLVPSVTEPLELYLTGGDGQSRSVKVLVHDRPRILATRFALSYPEYLQAEPKKMENHAGDIAMPLGTEVELAAECDQELEGGSVRFGKVERAPADSVEGKTLRHKLKPDSNGFHDLQVKSKEWRRESTPPLRFSIVVLPDQPPSISLALEGEARLMTPRGKIHYRVEAEDDHGFTALSLSTTLRPAGNTTAEEELVPKVSALERKEEKDEKGSHARSEGEVDLAPLGLAPGSTVTLQASVTDNDAVTGPKTATSQKETVLLMNLEEFRAAMEKIRVEAQAQTEELARREETVGELLGKWSQAPEKSSGKSRASAAAQRSSPASSSSESTSSDSVSSDSASSDSASSESQASESASSSSAQGSKSSRGSKSAKSRSQASRQASQRPARDPSPGAPEAEEPSSKDEEAGEDPVLDQLSSEQSAVSREAGSVAQKIRQMVSALRQNQLLQPAEERRFRDEVSKPLEEASTERLPRSASEISAVPRADRPLEEAAKAQRNTEKIADAMKRVAERLAGSGDFREILQRLELIIELQKKVISETEKSQE